MRHLRSMTLFAPLPRPLSEWPLTSRRGIRGVLTDIDDTLTTQGRLNEEARSALEALRRQGMRVVAVTGRPAGWSETCARDWPVDVVVSENGAVMMWRAAQGDLNKAWLQDHHTRQTHWRRLQDVKAMVDTRFPQARWATDSAGRETDIAVDHAEHHHLDSADIDAVASFMREQGLSATVSSIHINAWLGSHDKLAGARWALRYHWGIDLDAERDAWAYVGDSSNDQVMFAALPHTVGVRNIERYLPQLNALPAYITESERGAGFAEVVAALLSPARLPLTHSHR